MQGKHQFLAPENIRKWVEVLQKSGPETFGNLSEINRFPVHFRRCAGPPEMLQKSANFRSISGGAPERPEITGNLQISGQFPEVRRTTGNAPEKVRKMNRKSGQELDRKSGPEFDGNTYFAQFCCLRIFQKTGLQKNARTLSGSIAGRQNVTPKHVRFVLFFMIFLIIFPHHFCMNYECCFDGFWIDFCIILIFNLDVFEYLLGTN